MPSTQWLTIHDVAEQLKLSDLTVRRMVSRGEIKAFRGVGKSRLIRIKQYEVDKALKPVTSAAENLGGDAA